MEMFPHQFIQWNLQTMIGTGCLDVMMTGINQSSDIYLRLCVLVNRKQAKSCLFPGIFYIQTWNVDLKVFERAFWSIGTGCWIYSPKVKVCSWSEKPYRRANALLVLSYIHNTLVYNYAIFRKLNCRQIESRGHYNLFTFYIITNMCLSVWKTIFVSLKMFHTISHFGNTFDNPAWQQSYTTTEL